MRDMCIMNVQLCGIHNCLDKNRRAESIALMREPLEEPSSLFCAGLGRDNGRFFRSRGRESDCRWLKLPNRRFSYDENLACVLTFARPWSQRFPVSIQAFSWNSKPWKIGREGEDIFARRNHLLPPARRVKQHLFKTR